MQPIKYEMQVEMGKMREFAQAAKSRNPDHFGADPVMHPTFLTIARLLWEPVDGSPVASVGFDPRRMLHGEEEFVFHGPLPKAGEVFEVTSYVARRWSKTGGRGGEMQFALVVNEFRAADGTLAAEQRTTMIETAPEPQR